MKKAQWLILAITASCFSFTFQAKADPFEIYSHDPSFMYQVSAIDVIPLKAFGSGSSADLDGDGYEEVIVRDAKNPGLFPLLNSHVGPVAIDTVKILSGRTGTTLLQIYHPIIHSRISLIQPSKFKPLIVRPVGDMSGDGMSDVAIYAEQVVIPDQENLGPAVLVIDSINGNTIATLPKARQVENIGDFDGDGKEDLLVIPHGTLGTSFAPTSLGSAPVEIRSGADIENSILYSVGKNSLPISTNHNELLVRTVGDLNGDGIFEVSFSRSTSATSIRNGANLQEILYSIGSFPNQARLVIPFGDIDGDGRSELLAASHTGDKIEELMIFNGADGAQMNTFAAPQALTFDGQYRPLEKVAMVAGQDDAMQLPYFAAGDVNGDGKPDLGFTVPFTQPEIASSGCIYGPFGTLIECVRRRPFVRIIDIDTQETLFELMEFNQDFCGYAATVTHTTIKPTIPGDRRVHVSCPGKASTNPMLIGQIRGFAF